MLRPLRTILPQRLRLRLWLLRHWFTRDAFMLRRARPSRRRRILARVELARRIRRCGSGGLERFDAIRVVNLDARGDRLAETTTELHRLGIRDFERFEAVENDNGMLGCVLSHAELLRELLASDAASMLVCEDDVRFLLDRRRLDVLADAFLDDPEADVVCFAYFAHRTEPHDRLFLRGMSVQTTSCYAIKRRVARELLALWEEGAVQLAEGGAWQRHAPDRAWMPLQQTRTFLVPIIRAARQRSGYSDILQRHVEYTH